jgi:FkbM family methyltransferase
MFDHHSKPQLKILIDDFLERFGVRVRRSAFLPLSTSAVLHRASLRQVGAGMDGAGGIFFDVGAHLGETSISLARAFPRVRIHAFEPIAGIYKQLVHHGKRFPGITFHHLALGNENTERHIALVSNHVTCQLNQVSALADNNTPVALRETVKITRLDDFCLTNGINRIALLKTDTEGFEMEVLRGAANFLRQGQIASIMVEVTFLKNDSQHTPFEDVRAFLTPFGFELGGFYDTGYRRETAIMGYTNAFFTLDKSLTSN